MFVPRTGLEPARRETLAPETSASTIPPPGQGKYWAENETRTRDPNLGKVVLYQLSYFRKTYRQASAFVWNASAKVCFFIELTKNLLGFLI